MKTRELFSSNLKALRSSKKQSQQYVADALGLKRSTYSSYESGASEPELETLVLISCYFKVTLDTLLRRAVFLSEHNEVFIDREMTPAKAL